MKFYLGAAVAVIFLTGTVNAQHVNLGIKAGLNLYTIKTDNGTNFDSKAGFHAGLIGHIHLSKQFAVQPEIVYSAQGGKYTSAGVETKVKIGYINVPVMLQYMFDNGFRLQAGPQVGFLLSAESETGSVSTEIKDNVNTIDFALGAGIGYVHPASGLGIDARYNLGLSNINDESTVKSTNRGFQVGVFYLFHNK